jgi:hypothetical protein
VPTASDAGAGPRGLWPLSLLIAYPYLDSPHMLADLGAVQARFNANVIVDSGAFTAFQTGRVITLDEYDAFLDTLPLPPTHYVNLDVIGDPVGSWRNYEALRARGRHPLPVFTYGDEPAALERMYDAVGHDGLVGLGALVSRKGLHGYLAWLMPLVGARKAHLLGLAQPSIVGHWKPYSCDVSSYMMAHRYGTMPVYLGRGQWRRFERSDCTRPTPELHRLLLSYGVHPRDLTLGVNWSSAKALSGVVAVRSYMRYAADCYRFGGPHGGTLLYFAYATTTMLTRVIEEYERPEWWYRPRPQTSEAA